jgi:hypothetical protein
MLYRQSARSVVCNHATYWTLDAVESNQSVLSDDEGTIPDAMAATSHRERRLAVRDVASW